MAKLSDKLKKMKMPEKPMAEQEAEMDLGLEQEAMAEGEPMEQEMGEEEMEMGEMPEDEMMADLSDEMLLAEVKKRGLKMDEMPENGMEQEEELDIPEIEK